MQKLCVGLVLLIIATACNPRVALPTQTPAVAPEDLSQYSLDLIAANQNDVALLDHPTRYSMTLQFDPAGPTLNGAEDVRYFNRQSVPLNEIYFRLFANYPDSGGKITASHLSVDGAAAPPSYEMQNTALRVPLAKPLTPNASADVHLDFTVSIPRDNKNHYADFTSTDGIVTMPTVYPLIPAYDAKGWHIEIGPPYGDLVYADVSLYAVTLTVPSTMTVIASGSTIGKTENANGTTTWRLIGAPMRDFDLNLTDRLQKASAAVGETTVHSYYDPADVDSGKSALQFATDALRIYQKRFGVYPYREFKVIETPTTAGGIEYPGVAIIARGLYRTPRQRDFFEFATAHEVAHQWWYGMVGNDQVNEPWVDESLTQYSTLIYYEDLRGASVAQSILKDQFQNLYNRAKNSGHDAAVNQPVSAFNESDYSTIVYQKGPLFFDALRKKMGDALFFQFLRTYLERYRYKIATGAEVLKTAEGVYGSTLREEYQRWILIPAPITTPTPAK